MGAWEQGRYSEVICLANANVVLEREVVRGSVQISDGVIRSVEMGSAVPKGAIDMEGDFLAPGMIELHTDNLERHMHPRPKVNWPHFPALLAHDAEMAGAGVTTVFDALRVGSRPSGASLRFGAYARGVADELLELVDRAALRVSHHIHLRAEVCSETLVEELDAFAPKDRVRLVSLMDHTPGQRQFSDLAQFETYVCGKHGLNREQFEAHCAMLYDLRARFGEAHEAAIVAAAKRLGAVLASHDDTTPEQVKTSAEHGVRIAEFPTTRAAAEACHGTGIVTIMGAPNLVRGKSHSGNVAAIELAEADLLDILSSDYVPAALLMAAVQLGRLWGNMARGMSTVTAAPARAAGLQDRGVLTLGQRADLIRFRLIGDVPQLRETYVQGRRVA